LFLFLLLFFFFLFLFLFLFSSVAPLLRVEPVSPLPPFLRALTG